MINRRPLLLPFIFALALTLPDIAFAVDDDGDTFDSSIDCNDNDDSIYPGAPETVGDGIDQDCDGVDSCFVDNDNDNFGTAAVTDGLTLNCVIDAGRALVSGDCDDADAIVYPGAPEVVADGIDQDCDGVDSCFVDNDNDNFGTATATDGLTLSCAADAGRAPVSGDCDDGDASIRPGAPEVVADGIDQNCDGVDSCFVDNDNDNFGTATVTDGLTLNCVADAGRASNSADCDDASAATHPGAVEDCDDSADNDCDTSIDCADSECITDPACTVTTTTGPTTTTTTLPTTQVFDHLKCYKIKTKEKLAATVDMEPNELPFQVETGCTVKKARKYCVPVMKTVTRLESSMTPDPTYVGQELTDDRICYKVKCPGVELPTIEVQDQFGTRTFSKFKASEICTPARKIAP